MKVCFTFVGPLQFRGRLFKQIKTLQTSGFECILIHGQTELEQPDYSNYNFKVISIRVVQERLKILTLASQLAFAYKAAYWIEKIGASVIVSVAIQSALSGALAKSRNSALKFIYDNNELSLEMISSGIKRGIWSYLHSYILKYADVVMHAEQRRMNYFHSKYKTRARSFLLENLPFFRPETPNVGDLSKNVKCIHLGMFQPDRFCEEMLIAFSELSLTNVTFDMAGFYIRANYKRVIKELLEKTKSRKIRILPPVPHQVLYDFLGPYDIGLAFYKNTNLNNFFCAPNKVYDYIQMGLAVITNDYPGLIDVVEKNRIGICVPSVDKENIESAIKIILRENMHKNINENMRKRFSWESQEKRYIELFHK